MLHRPLHLANQSSISPHSECIMPTKKSKITPIKTKTDNLRFKISDGKKMKQCKNVLDGSRIMYLIIPKVGRKLEVENILLNKTKISLNLGLTDSCYIICFLCSSECKIFIAKTGTWHYQIFINILKFILTN